MKATFIILFLLLFSVLTFSQTLLEGTVTDGETGEPIIFGTVALFHNDVLITGTETDFNGHYSIPEINLGIYDVLFSYTGFQDYKVTGILVKENVSNKLDVKINGMSEFVICCFPSCNFRPLVSTDETTQGFRLNAEQIRIIAH